MCWLEERDSAGNIIWRDEMKWIVPQPELRPFAVLLTKKTREFILSGYIIFSSVICKILTS